ncbi:MAG: WG repeat-containing protein [Bacteroidota bacterium]
MKHPLLTFGLVVFVSLSVSAQQLFPILLKNKWGYMNTEGKVIIQPKYDIALEFNEGHAVVALSNQPCLINVQEKRIIDTGLYEYISTFSEGLCAVRDFKKHWCYINNTGKTILKLDSFVYEANPFYNGLARVSKKVDDITQKFGFDISNLSYRFAYINKNGAYVSDFKYRDAVNFNTNVARVRENGLTYLINTSCTKISEEFSEISDFSDSLAICIKEGKFGYINTSGMVVILNQYDFATMFFNGFAEISMNGKSCFINKLGEKQFEPVYEELRPFAEGFAGFKQGAKLGFINAKGQIQMNPYYDEVAYFANGLCPVRKGSKWGAINAQGKLIIKLEYDFVGTFDDGIAEVVYSGVSLYADTRGNLLPIWDKQ